MSVYSRKKKMQEREKADYKILLSWIMIAIIPLIVQLIMRNNTLINYSWYSSNETEVDFFLRYKMFGIIIVMCMMVLVFVKDSFSYNNYLVSKCCKSNDKFVSIMFKAVILFEICALLSALFANDKKAAFTGGYAQHEPFFVLLAYGVILLFTYCYINNVNTLMLLYRLFLIGVAIMAIIGLSQYFKADFFASPIGKRIITVFSGIDPERVNMKFEPGRVYMTYSSYSACCGSRSYCTEENVGKDCCRDSYIYAYIVSCRFVVNNRYDCNSGFCNYFCYSDNEK